MIEKVKVWLIKKLGGYSKAEYESLLKCSASIVTPARRFGLKKYCAYYNPEFQSVWRPKDEELLKERLLWTLAQGIKDNVEFGKIPSPSRYTYQYYAEITIAEEA